MKVSCVVGLFDITHLGLMVLGTGLRNRRAVRLCLKNAFVLVSCNAHSYGSKSWQEFV